MTLLENALKKLQAGRASTAPAAVVQQPSSRKKGKLDGPRHPISLDGLCKEGLLPPADQPSPVSDQFRKIKRPLIANALRSAVPGGSRMNVIMIASALPKAGKSFCSVNLAISMAIERDLNVLLVDADVAKPHITRAFGLADKPGLIDLLLDEDLQLPDLLVRTDLNDIQVLPAGRNHPHATELLASGRMSRLVSELATRYADRLILLDSPPLLITSEAQALADQVGQIALVVEARGTTHQQLSQVIHMLDSNKSISLILNKSLPWRWNPAGEYYGAYGSGYDGR